jgi:DNA-binding NarL/FixJ family response regulator
MAINIFLIDDHFLVLEGIKSIMQTIDDVHVIGTAENGSLALQGVKENYKNIDIIFCDINLPDMSGIDLCKQLKKEFPEIKILALSNFYDINYITQMIKNGASGYILKNANIDDFNEAINKTMKGKSYFTDEVQMMILQSNGLNESIPEVTPREKEVLIKIAEGLSNQQIADTLFVSVTTIETHRKNLFAKFKVNNPVSLVKNAMEFKII